MPQQLTLAIDVGNTRVKFGVFERGAGADSTPALPACVASLAVPLGDGLNWAIVTAHFQQWMANVSNSVVAGANPRGVELVVSGWPGGAWPAPRIVRTAGELPLRVNLDAPDKVGIDRLFDAVAANRLRQPSEPVLVVDAGTATTVNYISEAGAF